MRRAHVIAGDRSGHQLVWGGAFADGLKRHGWEVSVGPQFRVADLLIVWGVRKSDWISAAKFAGAEVCVLERGYVGDRNAWTSVSFGGGLNGRGEFRGPFADGSRWQRHFAHLRQPWRRRADGDVLIMGQVDGDMAVADVDIRAFYREASKLFFAAGFNPRYRPHPLSRDAGESPEPLATDLATARAVVTWNSNSAVDAVLAGVPAVAINKGSMAYDVAGHTLGEMPPMPDRTAWAHRLAWCQWRSDEIASGACWDHVGRERVAA